jgi:ornithine decarboxylase
MHGSLALELSTSRISALTHETPYFLISKHTLLERFGDFRQLFPGASIHYALKANSEPEILRLLADAGAGFEAASRYELELLRTIGIAPDRIIYGTSIKSTSHIVAFRDYAVDRFACDSLAELEKIAAVSPGARVYVRLSVNDAGSVFKFSEKFGTDKASAVSLLRQAKSLGLQPYGLSFHVGSQARNASAWANALADVRDVMRDLERTNIRIEALNIGGGFPCQYASSETVPSLAEIADCLYSHLDTLPYRPQLILEPGRGIVAEAAVLVASVIGRVRRGEHSWLFLDAGVYNGLFEAMAYQGSTRYPIDSVRLSNASGEALFALAGPTGDSPDIITREALLPRDIDVGDRLIIRNAGAYSLSVTSTFNGFPKPPVYLV